MCVDVVRLVDEGLGVVCFCLRILGSLLLFALRLLLCGNLLLHAALTLCSGILRLAIGVSRLVGSGTYLAECRLRLRHGLLGLGGSTSCVLERIGELARDARQIRRRERKLMLGICDLLLEFA